MTYGSVSARKLETMSLDTEIEAARRKVSTDEYGMSIGEIVTMYEKDELVINPAFQRLFRWEDHQKSKFIESILLGIPIPPVFVFETREGQWELIDGLQRISTILEFIGLLRNPKTQEIGTPSKLSATNYLPSLKNAEWDNPKLFSKSLQFTFRRARLSDLHSKTQAYFRRTNAFALRGQSYWPRSGVAKAKRYNWPQAKNNRDLPIHAGSAIQEGTK